jgi:hypothetical protein
MANQLYPLAKTALLTNSPTIDLDSIEIRASLVTAGYTYSATHQYITSVSSTHRVATATLLSKTIVSGVFDAADVTFTNVSGSEVTQIIIWQWSGTEATSPLLAIIDSATGLPKVPNGGNIIISWNAAGIFAL